MGNPYIFNNVQGINRKALEQEDWALSTAHQLIIAHQDNLYHCTAEEEHGILTDNGTKFSLPNFHFQFKSVNISTILSSKLKMCLYVWRLDSWLSLGIDISWVESGINKQICLNFVLFVYSSYRTISIKNQRLCNVSNLTLMSKVSEVVFAAFMQHYTEYRFNFYSCERSQKCTLYTEAPHPSKSEGSF